MNSRASKERSGTTPFAHPNASFGRTGSLGKQEESDEVSVGELKTYER